MHWWRRLSGFAGGIWPFDQLSRDRDLMTLFFAIMMRS
jgi:hypothetical protein